MFLALLGSAHLYNNGQSPVPSFGDQDFNRFDAVATRTAITVPTTGSTQLLPANHARRYAIFSNTGANPVCIAMATSTGGTPIASNCTGIMLAANGGQYTIDANNLYTGAVHGMASGTASVVAVTEAQ